MNYAEKTFLEELLDLVRVLENTQNVLEIQPKLIKISNKYADISCKNNIWTVLDDMCGDIPQTYIILLEYLYKATKDEEVTKKELQVLEKGTKEGTLDLFCAIFYKWQIAHRIFMDYNGKPFYIERSNLNKVLLGRMKDFLQLSLPPIEEEKQEKERVVVAITQFLGLKHGPTRNALDYCYTLQKKLKKEVFLLVATEGPIDEVSGYESFGLDYFSFNYVRELEGYFTYEYLGEKIMGCQCRISEANKPKVKEIIQSLYEWKPSLIYNIGSENLVIDLLGTFTKEVTILLGNNFPISEGQNLILSRKIEERDNEIINYITSKKQKLIESIFVYKLEKPIKIYKKAEFGIDDKAYVIAIVGTRLDQEIDDAFISILHTILEMEPSINIVFIGSFTAYDSRKAAIGYEDRVRYIGHQPDLRGVLNIADLYLNPVRKGGGTSSVEALAEGVPVITLPYCDVAYSCGEAFYCDSAEDMPKLIMKYMSDKDFYESQSKLAKIQADKVVNTEEVLRGILEQID